MTIENPLAESLQDQRVALYMPVEQTNTQRLVGLEVSAPHRVLHDPVGNTILEVTFKEFPAYATRVVSVVATVKMSAEPRQETLSAHEPFLQQEAFIEVSDPAIAALARQLRRETADDTVRAIYDWVSTNLDYAGFIAEDLGAKYALRHRRGDCTEYAYLAAALARANGVPARVLGGYATSMDAAPRARDYHNWTEVYVDGAWRLLDAQKQRLRTGAGEYVAMRVVSSDGSAAMGENHRFAVHGRVLARME